MNPRYEAFVSELELIAKEAAVFNKEELKDAAKDFLRVAVPMIPAAGLGTGMGWLLRKKVLPKVGLTPAQRAALAMIGGTLGGIGSAYLYGRMARKRDGKA